MRTLKMSDDVDILEISETGVISIESEYEGMRYSPTKQEAQQIIKHLTKVFELDVVQ